MGWADFYRRRDAIDLVLTQAGRPDLAAGLPFDGPDLAAVRQVFADRESLALALQYKWSQVLSGHIAVAIADADRTHDTDQVAAVAAAWRTAARRHPALRTLLARHLPDAGTTFRQALCAEQRMVAFAAGLAEPSEPADETSRIGAAFLALISTTPTRPVRRAGPVEQLLRRLVASS